ncbi:MAG TPA: PilZ domain-containing protein [Desulfobacterales bacterium]|nr:PilZ domain-containing protein [Desulfobacterales bacterium]
MSERRKSGRFLAQDRAFAVLRPDFARLGKIKDISEGGLSFEYIAHQEEEQDASELDIFLSEGSFHLSKMPCSIIYDIRMREGHQTSAARIQRRRCGLHFGRLTQEQARQLDFFLKNHTRGSA